MAKKKSELLLDIFETYATDEIAERDGAVINLTPTATVTVTRSGNEKYLSRMVEEYEANREILDSKTPAAKDLDRKCHAKVLAETVLVGFSGLSYKGKPLEYSTENAEMLLQHNEFLKKIVTLASDRQNFKAKAEAADVKN